jgi:hypothetical protein
LSAEVNGDPPLETLLERFWDLGEDLAEIRFQVRGPRIPETILKRLGGPPLDEDSALARSELSQLYRRVSEQAMRSAFDEA